MQRVSLLFLALSAFSAVFKEKASKLILPILLAGNVSFGFLKTF